MPYHVEDDHPDCSGFAVVKDSDRTVMGCHETLREANAQVAALYANESEADSTRASNGREVRHGPLGQHDRRLLPAQVLRRIAEGYGEQALAVAHRGFDIDYRGCRLEHRATSGHLELLTFPVVGEAQNTATADTRARGAARPIQGYASRYGVRYNIWGGPPFGFTEMVVTGAAERSIKNQDDVFLFFDHDGLPLARTKAKTLELQDQPGGLHVHADIDPASPFSMEILSRIESKELDAMSFAFEVVDDDWNDDYTERTIRQVKLYDVSVVSFPANPETEVGLRSDLGKRTGMSISRARAEMEALALRGK